MSETPGRLARLRAAMAQAGHDALLVTEPHNRRYLTDFTGSAGMVLVLPDRLHLLVDSRYYEQVRRQAPGAVLEEVGYQPHARLAELLTQAGLARAAFEMEDVTVEALRKLEDKVPDVAWEGTSGLVGGLRQQKSASEVEIIARAVALADRAMEHAYGLARPGMSERDLAWRLEVFMREAGASGLSFDIIVAAGENGALPHHRASERVIGEGEPIVIDLGCVVDGYCSDLTRTFSLGPATDSDYDDVYAVVDAANRAAVAALRPGARGKEVDAVARSLIGEAGFGDAFGHGLGHGVGLAVHEGPRLSPLAEDSVIPEGAVVTVEPGIYLPGRFGVRIEDMIVVGPQGPRVLTAVAKVAVLPLSVHA